jgi:LCP family protein required for cell wall assembly
LASVARRGLLAAVALAVVGAIALAMWCWSAITTIAPRTSLGDVLAPIDGASAASGSVAWKVRRGDRITLLLLARGGADAEAPELTDAVLLFSVGGKRQPTLISLPRWLSVKIPAPAHGYVMGQLYNAYALGSRRDSPTLGPQWRTSTGAGDLAAATASALAGVTVDGWTVIDLRGFRALVDAVGGIEVTVPAPLDDARYPTEDARHTMRIHFNAGAQRMNGEQALEYARSRLSTSEADRSYRQQLVLTALLRRSSTLSLGPGLIPLIAALRDRMTTNLRPADFQALVPLLRGSGQEHSRRISVEDTDLVRKLPIAHDAYILLPRDPTYQTLRTYLSAALTG